MHDNDLRPVLLIHGGAGVIRKDTDEAEQAIRAALAQALRAGHAKLQAGGSALDAVGAAVVVLEDAPHFNAGRGAVFTHDGHNELDAAIMDGAILRAGAIAGVRRVRNPVLLARAVMEHSPHVMLAGAGAETFAREQGIALVEPEYFRTEHRWRQLQEALAKESSGKGAADYFGTVGAVARDASGNLAAATSTGGMTDKHWNRIGDSPVIGAGTYANSHCAVSGTGWGEFYIRTCAAHSICMRVAQGEPLADVAEDVINRGIPRLGGNGGAIVLGRDGHFALPFNTQGMYRGWIGVDGAPHVAIYRDE
ncbi:MAG TPA: isoaspartyl peptidase/L-asparaginase [Rhodanobacteraceae bacterium]|nr:isoaspartyl peptidase/L-asparaginase [Rhodanobacteraceae bacterium]